MARAARASNSSSRRASSKMPLVRAGETPRGGPGRPAAPGRRRPPPQGRRQTLLDLPQLGGQFFGRRRHQLGRLAGRQCPNVGHQVGKRHVDLVPTAEITGIREAEIARTTGSSLNAHKSSMLPPPRVTTRQSSGASGQAIERCRWRRRSRRPPLRPARGRAPSARRPPANAGPAPGENRGWPPRWGWSPRRSAARTRGSGRLRAGSKSPSRASFSRSCRKANSNAPMPRGTMSSMINW